MTVERLKFAEPPPEEEKFRRRSSSARREIADNQEVYGVYRVLPLVRKVMEEDQARFRQGAEEKKQEQREILRAVWGATVELPSYLSPSTIAFCLRWVGYEALGFSPASRPVEDSLTMTIGSAAHYSVLQAIKRAIPGQIEMPFVIDEADLSGRIDFLFRNPRTAELQIIEFKFISDYGFRKIGREGLEETLRSTKNIFVPQPEHKKQVLLYLWSKERQQEKVACANIVYVNRNTGQCKEAIIVWDEEAKYEAEELISKVKLAKAKIETKELPEPSVESPYICAKFCPFRIHCKPGQKFAAGQIRLERKRKPAWVKKKAVEDHARRMAIMEEKGLIQGKLPGFSLPEEEGPKRKEKKEAPVCAECGQSMAWQKNAAKGGRFVCSHCGHD